ncbi:MAG: hypothetical protein QOG03_514, partial [Actinomycetota bacterium]|nr:hypothetical protein [Actinomycetota bacterium]
GLSVAPADLTTEVLRTYALVGHQATAADRAALAVQAARVPTSVRSDFAALLATVNATYAAQLPIVAAVHARWEAGFDPHVPLLTQAERDVMTARQAGLMTAINHFRAIDVPRLTASNATPANAPVFADPEGLVILGGTANDTYNKGGLVGDPVLLVDPAGSDTYNNSAGGACPFTPSAFGQTWLQCNTLVVSVVADLGDGTTTASNDTYAYNGLPAAVQGAGGPGGIGLLVDVGGDDTYRATMTRGNVDAFQPVVYYFDGGAQGYGYAGNGALVDGVGNDLYDFAVKSTSGYSIWALAQGFGGAGGVGLALDGGGSDQWLNEGLGLTGRGFQGIYTMGTGFYGGVGIIDDQGLADDTYKAVDTAQTTDYYAQGFGAFGGLGIQADDGGNDSYYAAERASNPFIDPLLNCDYGTGSYAGVGIMLEGGGNDSYYGETTSSKSADIDNWGAGHPGVSYGLFLDAGGVDRYEEKAVSTTGQGTSTAGFGLWQPALGGDILDAPLGENTFGTFVDLGGQVDTYIGAPTSAIQNNAQWAFGVDR